MSGRIELQDFCEIVQGGRHGLSGNHFVEVGFPAYGAGGMNGFLATFEFEKPAVVLSSIGARCGKCFYADGKWSSLANTQVIFPDPERADARFLWYQLNDEARWHRSGTAQPFIKPSDVKAHRVYLPALPEQKRIAAILDQAEALRAKRRLALATLDTLTQSLFLDLFGDLGTNPKEWPVVEIGSAVRVEGGFAFKSDDFAGEGCGIVRISNLVDGRVDLADIARIPDDKIGKGERFRVFPGDILIAMSGATTGKIGVVPADLEETLYQNQRVGNFRIIDKTKIRREFLLALLESGFYQKSLWQFAAGVAQPNVSSKQLESVPVFFPPMKLQNTFAAQINILERLKVAQQVSLAKLDALFASLQHRAFRGEL